MTGKSNILRNKDPCPEGHNPGAHHAPGVRSPSLLEQPRPVPCQAVNGIKHNLPQPHRQGGVGEAWPHVCRKVHLEEPVGDFCIWYVTCAAPGEDCFPETFRDLLPGATKSGGVVWGEHETKHLELFHHLEPGEGRVLPARPGTKFQHILHLRAEDSLVVSKGYHLLRPILTPLLTTRTRRRKGSCCSA